MVTPMEPSKMSSSSERCGPLCQHPGCWHSTKAPHGSSSSYYIQYLSHLASRKSRKTRDRSKSAGYKRSSLTADGLPTLKVQTLEQNHMTNGLQDNRKRSRAYSLPPVRTNSGEGSVYIGHHHATDNKNVHFVQMHLEEEPVACNDLSELVFSPVLIWKPGKHPPNRHTSHPPHTCTMLHTSLPSHPTPHTPSHSPKTSRPLSRLTASPVDTRLPRAKSPLHLKRTDLTNTLPPHVLESSTELQDKKFDGDYQRVTTAEAKNFSYLGDIPRQFVAEIIQQLRSESTSNIERTLPVPIPSAVEVTTDNPPTTHVPSSLTYDLTTKRIARTKLPPTPKARTTSFSRELSKRPLEVLRKKTSDRLEPISEGVGGDRTLKSLPIDMTVIQSHMSRFPVKSLEALMHRQPLPIEHAQKVEEFEEEKHTSPRRINLELGELPMPVDSKYVGPKRSKSKTLTQNYSSPRPFSEESSIAVSKQPVPVTEGRRVDSHRVMSSASPDFMLVGAHFTDDRLVLTERGAQIVHQLTETESDMNLQAVVRNEEHTEQDVMATDCNDLENPSSGVRPPPSTAVDNIRSHPTCNTLTPTDELPEQTTIEDRQPNSKPLEHSDEQLVPFSVADGAIAPPSTAVENTRISQHTVRDKESTAGTDETRQLATVVEPQNTEAEPEGKNTSVEPGNVEPNDQIS